MRSTLPKERGDKVWNHFEEGSTTGLPEGHALVGLSGKELLSKAELICTRVQSAAEIRFVPLSKCDA